MYIMSQSGQEKFGGRIRYRSRPSLFGPIVLIGLGTAFLLYNLGFFSDRTLNWFALLQLWPLWLILLGVNVIVRQAPGGLGSLFSALVGVAAIGVCAYVLLLPEDSALLDKLGGSRNLEFRTETVEFSADDVTSADVDITFHSQGVNLYALSDSPNLIEGTVTYTGDLIFNTSRTGGTANVRLDTHSEDGDWLFFLNPTNWNTEGNNQRWQIGLDPDVALNLTLDVGSGSADLDLSHLDLSDLNVDGGSGSAEIILPNGDYSVNHDAGSGSTRMTLPSGGRQTIEIRGGSGSITI